MKWWFYFKLNLDLKMETKLIYVFDFFFLAEVAEMKELCKERDGQLALLRQQTDKLR